MLLKTHEAESLWQAGGQRLSLGRAGEIGVGGVQEREGRCPGDGQEG